MKVLTNNQYYSQIANIIREQNGTNNTYTPPQMVSALKDLFYEEVEGVPPISFNGIGENLLDYRIDGASGGVGDKTSNLAKWDAHLQPQTNGIVLNDLNSISSIIDVTSINNIYLYGDRKKLNSNVYRIGKSNEPISLNSQTTRITYAGNILDTSDCNYVIVSCSIYNTETTFDDIKNSFMIVEGSSEPSVFEPYGYKVPVVVNGKNLFDENSELNTNSTMDLTTGTFPGSTGDNKRTFFFKAKPNTTYTFSCDTIGDRLVICEYNRIINPSDYSTSHKITPNIKTFSQASGISEYSFTTSSTTKMVGIYYSLNTLPTSIQIELGDTVTTYEEYTATTTNIYLDNPIRTVEDEVEYIDYSEQKQHRVRKNLLQNTATTQTINGVNVIVNNDGSIKLSGTSTAITYIDINSNFNSTEFQDCYLNPFYPNNFVSSASTVLLRISNTTNRNSIQDFLNNSVIRDNGSNLRLAIRIGQNYTFSNDFVISPMISKFSDNTYEPYIENTEVDVTLPAIPTLDGTNTLSIDTTVQPSNVYIKSRHESSYETAMRERYEEQLSDIESALQEV